MRRTSRGVVLALALALGGCGGAYQIHSARTVLPGMSVPDLLSCAGLPAAPPVQITPTDWDLPYKFTSSATPAFEVKILTDLDLQIGNKGGCELTVRVSEPGRVVSVHPHGTELSTEGVNAACGPLVMECREHADHTGLPAGYNLPKYMKALGGKGV